MSGSHNDSHVPMSLFEWLGESINPGPTGNTKLGARKREEEPRVIVLLRGFIALVLLAAAVAIMAGPMTLRDFTVYRNAAIGFSVYALIAHFVHPEPDTSNMGYLGGIVGDPLRISDDHNRFLFFFGLLLAPGRFFAEALVDNVRLLWRACRKKSPETERP
jgi:hypothetical protein